MANVEDGRGALSAFKSLARRLPSPFPRDIGYRARGSFENGSGWEAAAVGAFPCRVLAWVAS